MADPFADLSPDLQEHYQNMQDDLYDGLTDKVVAATKQALAWGQSPANILEHGLVAGMDLVGQDFGAGILFVPEVLRAANAMKAAMEILRPLLTETGAPKIGVAVIGTVKGDIHDIGKNLVAMMWEGAGFEVHNLGNNVDADKLIAAIRAHNAHILGMSALLTTTMPYMATVIERLKA
ncbi:MAG: cobalamin-dependent protein, partial [Anaerolineae bacterium]|nr:cobalamin-dependent protein [Anaerolineae bacterium]